MNCDDCRQRLQACLDGEPTAADDIAAHVAACPACRALAAAARRLRLGLRAAAAAAPPAGLAERIVAGVLADRRRRQRARRSALFIGAGLAAAACLAVAFLLHQRVPGESAAAPQPTGKTIVAAGAGVPTGRRDQALPDQPAAPPSLNDNVAEATSAVASLARRTADQTLTSGQMFLPAVPREVPPEQMLAAPLDPPAQSLREAGQGVATGLGPVADSARRALDLFLRDIPPVAADSKSDL